MTCCLRGGTLVYEVRVLFTWMLDTTGSITYSARKKASICKIRIPLEIRQPSSKGLEEETVLLLWCWVRKKERFGVVVGGLVA